MSQNADVEWFREWKPSRNDAELWIDPARRASILAHIDQLEAEVRRLTTPVQLRHLTEPEPSRAPTVDEIAAQITAAYIADGHYHDPVTAATHGYDAAEALVAERERRRRRRRNGEL